MDRRQDRADIHVEEHLEDLAHHPWACGRALHPRRELDDLRVVGETGSEQLDRSLGVGSPVRGDELLG